MRFVVLTDTHFVPGGRKLFGLDPAARLSAAIRTINRDHYDIDFVILTGDLAHNGELAAYEHLKSTLEASRAPVILMMGNHDRRDAFREAFPDADADDNGFVQSVRTFDAATVVTLDTLDEGNRTHAGRLCKARLAFLEGALQMAPAGRPVILFQHHPPFDTGLPHMDPIKLSDLEEEWEVIRRTRLPDFLFIGHVHRPISGVWRGVPFQIQRAINHQVAFDLVTDGYIPGSHEDPDYSLVTISGREIIVLQRSFLYNRSTFSLDDPEAAAAQSIEELRS